MNKSCTEEIEGYIKRSIADIARKCGVSNTDVIETIKKIINK
jgi:DNA-binding Lrp family transcriptional regulator